MDLSKAFDCIPKYLLNLMHMALIEIWWVIFTHILKKESSASI